MDDHDRHPYPATTPATAAAIDEPIIEPPEPGAWTIERATVLGLGVSVIVHIIVLVIALLVRFEAPGQDRSREAPEPVEFAVLPRIESERPAAVEVPEVEFESIDAQSEEQLDLLETTDTQESVDELTDQIAPEIDLGGGSIADTAVRTGSAGAGSGQGANFFGLEAAGQRFAYIVDRSGSMNSTMDDAGVSRWQRTQIEVVRSIRALGVGAKFSIVFYSSGASPLFGADEWIKSDRPNTASASAAVMRLTAQGETRPRLAFERVFRLEPEPDAIYFMTDGEFEPGVVQDIERMNRRRRIPIHCILYGTLRTPEAMQRVGAMMRNIARRSGGRYRHIADRGMP